MMIWAIALIDAEYPQVEVVGMIHNSLVAYLPADEAALWCWRLAEVMSNLPFHQVGWQPQLQFTVDAEAGPTLAAVKQCAIDCGLTRDRAE